MKIVLALLAFLVFTKVAYTAVISLEEGDDDNKRTFKMAMDQVTDPLPLPRFEYQDGVEAEYKKYALLGTLDCSSNPDDEVSMAIYDLSLGEWVCTLTSALPNDDDVDTDAEEGLLEDCTLAGEVAVWSRSQQAWTCSEYKPLLTQAQGLAQDLCRSEDILVVNLEEPLLASALCQSPTLLQVGPNAILPTISLDKRAILYGRNPGDPDEAFYVQSTSKAVGEYAESKTFNHYAWQYWKWSPVRTTFPAGMGSYPPTFPYTGHLVAVTAATYDFDEINVIFTPVLEAFTIRVVKVTPGLESYVPVDWSEELTMDQSPDFWVQDGLGTELSLAEISPGEAISIRVVNAPTTLNGDPRDSYLAVSIWVSHIQIEE